MRKKVPVRIFGPKRGSNVWNIKTVKMELRDFDHVITYFVLL